MSQMITFKWGDRVFQEAIEGNIELSELTPDEVKNALNRAVGKYAYYASLRADAKHMQCRIETEAAAWSAQKFSYIKNQPDYKKETGKVIEVQIIVQFEPEWKAWEARKASIGLITDKLYVLVQSFELMTKTLQSVLSTLREELKNASSGGPVRGSGDLLEN